MNASHCCALLSSLLLGAVATRAAQAEPELLTYRTTSQRELRLHVFRPEGERTPRAAIIIFIGGGWKAGQPSGVYEQCRHFASLGLVAIAPEYRVTSIDQSTPADSMADGIAAVRWVADRTAELGVDPARLVVMGLSAGGHLALSAWLLVPEPAPKVAAFLLLNPVTDTTATGYGAERCGPAPAAMSPYHHLRRDLPPTLIMHGDADTTVPHENSVRFAARARELGTRCELVTYPGQPHSFFQKARNPALYAETLARCDAFLRSLHLLP